MPLPEALLQSLEGVPGYDRAALVGVHEAAEVRASVRLNPAKQYDLGLSGLSDAWRWSLDRPVTPQAVPWWPHGYSLQPRPAFFLDPLWHAGVYYVQEASSMFLGYAVEELLEGRTGLRVLDVCASPGGKSTQLASLPQTGLLLSNETIRSRVPALNENLVKWGSPHACISSEDPAALARLEDFFDLMVVDAPCSGSGLFRRQPEAVGEWTPAHVDLCQRRQRRILAEVLPALAPGGLLFYATCSYSPAENEEVVDWLVQEQGLEGLRVRIPEAWGIVEVICTSRAVGYRFFPDRLAGEGFFLACLQKSGTRQPQQSKVRPSKSFYDRGSELSAWMTSPSQCHVYEQSGSLYAVPQALAQDIAILSEALRLRKAGVRLGRWVRGTLLPDHELAMSPWMHPQKASLPLAREQAIRYLRRASVDTPEHPLGWAVATWQGVPLGLLKCMPGRTNNHYPAEWRIRRAGLSEAE
ncbi:MAG: hypothetical protein FJX89_03090 [Bacteroidetes bacterium]|nr:hypothetical protein [Bacteroidota bacterium]